MMKLIALICPLAMLPLGGIAQDDMYFVPSKTEAEPMEEVRYYHEPEAYSPGSMRDVDEYNRMGSYVMELDSANIDIIDFDGQSGVYPDSIAPADDYACTRQMSRFDGYSWVDPYWDGYWDGRYDYWHWYSPWSYAAWGYYWPWRYSYWWYDPWYYYGGWYPHHHHWGGTHWGGTHWDGGRHWVSGTRNHSRGNSFGRASTSSSQWGRHSVRNGSSVQNRSTSTMRGSNSANRVSSQRSNYDSNRSSFSTPRQSSSSSFRSGGSFGGGSRSGGTMGGSRGGGSFRGRR